jgi:two-component system sensor histidine kinase VicK
LAGRKKCQPLNNNQDMSAAAAGAPEDFFDFLARSAKQVVFAYHLPGNHFLYLHGAFEQLWTQSRQQVLHEPRSLLGAVHPEDQEYLRQAFGALLAGQEQHGVEFRLPLNGRGDRWVSVSAYRRRSEDTLIGFAQDISLRKQHEDNERKFATRKNALLEVLSHDLSAPLVNIQGFASLLNVHLKYKENDQLQDAIQMLEEVARRNVQLIRTFVDQEALETAKVALLKERLDVVLRTMDLVDQLKISEAALRKEFRLESSQPSIFLWVDEAKFTQVIGNLLSNAIKFTPDGGQITVRIEEQPKRVLMSVSDNGIGIPARLQDKVFLPFTRAKRPGLRGEEPTGLGLSVVKSIVELHDGRIWLESEEHQGTTFYVEFPKP